MSYKEALKQEPEAMEESVSETDVAPDGGYGWVILGSGFMCIFVLDGLNGTFGLLYPELLHYFNASPSFTSMVGSTMIGTFLLVGVFTSFLINKFGCRLVAFVGACISSVGFLLCFAATDIWFLFFTYGIVTGTGMGLVYLPSMLMVNAYFNRKRGIAQGIVTSAAGMGMLAIAPLMETSLETFGWRGTMFICASLTFQLCISAALMRPLKINRNVISISVDDVPENKKTDLQYVTGETINQDNFLPKIRTQNGSQKHLQIFKYPSEIYCSTNSLPLSKKSFMPQDLFRSLHCIATETNPAKSTTEKRSIDMNPFLRKDIFHSGSLQTMRNILKTSEYLIQDQSASADEEKMLDCDTNSSDSYTFESKKMFCGKSVLTNKAFLLLVAGAALTQMAQHIPVVFLADHGIHIGVERRSISVILAVFGVLNTLGRLFSGALANTRVISPLALCNIGMFACAVTCFLFPLCTSVGTLTAFAVALGFFLGVFPPLQPLMAVECVGLENLTNAFGIMTMCKGPAAIAGPPLAGAVYEYTKNYSSSVGFAGLLFLLTTIVQCMVPLCGKRDSRFLCLSSCVHSESNTCSNKKYVKSDVDGNESSTTDSSMT